MNERIWTLYKVELSKALCLKAFYLGPLAIILLVALAPLADSLERDGISDYAFAARTTAMTLDLAGLLFILAFCACLVSSELGSGTVRMILVRPVRRQEYIAAKFLIAFSYAAMLAVAAAGTSWLMVLVFGDAVGVTYGDEIIYTSREMVLAYCTAFVLALPPLFAAAAYAVMLSTLTTSTGTAVGAAIGLWVATDALKYLFQVRPLLFSSYLEMPWRIFADRCDALATPWTPAAWHSLAVSGVSLAIFVAVACVAIARRDL